MLTPSETIRSYDQRMSALLNPISFLVTCLSGWLSQHQQLAIDYLTEENRVLREQSVTDDFDSPMLNGAGLPSGRKS